MKLGPKDILKIIIYVFCAFFVAAGIALIDLGIKSLEGIEPIQGVIMQGPLKDFASYLQAFPKVFIGVGCFSVIIAILGIVGAIKVYRILLYVFCTLLVIICLIALGLAIAICILKPKLEELGSKEGLKLLALYNSGEVAKQKDFDDVQGKLKCCGMKDYKDWFNKEVSPPKTGPKVPGPCCKNKNEKLTCSASVTDSTSEGDAEKVIYTNGCLDKAFEILAIDKLMYAGFVVGILGFGAVIAAYILCCQS